MDKNQRLKMTDKKVLNLDIEDLIIGRIYTNRDVQTMFKVSGQGGMRKSNRTNSLVLISKNHGKNQERNPYEDKWVDGIFHYTGMGRIGDQSIDYMQNKTLSQSRSNDISIYLFESFGPNEYTYMGEVKLADDPYSEREPDANHTMRNVIKFPLALIKS